MNNCSPFSLIVRTKVEWTVIKKFFPYLKDLSFIMEKWMIISPNGMGQKNILKMLLYLCFILGLKLFENHLSPSCSILGDWINAFTFLWFSIECKCTITLELHRNNSYGYVKDKKEVGHELSKKSLGMVKVLMLKVPFQLSNVLNSPHVSLTEFTIGRIMSHFLMLPLLYFLLICMNLACLIINYWSTCHYECHLTFKTSSYASFLHSNHWYQFWRENSKWEPNKFSFS